MAFMKDHQSKRLSGFWSGWVSKKRGAGLMGQMLCENSLEGKCAATEGAAQSKREKMTGTV